MMMMMLIMMMIPLHADLTLVVVVRPNPSEELGHEEAFEHDGGHDGDEGDKEGPGEDIVQRSRWKDLGHADSQKVG